MPKITRVIFDHSAMCMLNYFKTLTPGFVSDTGTEQGDFAKLIASAYYEMILRFNPSEIVFALDSKPYWRTFYYAQEYANNSCRIYKHKTDLDSFLLDMDKSIYQVKRNDITANWEVIKNTQSQAQQKGINVDLQDEDAAEYVRISLGDISDQQARDALMGQIPAYKGSRTKTVWKGRTPKEEVQKLFRNFAYNFAPLVCGKVVEVPYCEADDIIHEYTKMDPSSTTILVSLDMDLQQCCLNGLFVNYWNCRERDWMSRERNEVLNKLYYKVIGGDTSDNIKGCSMVGRAGSLPEVKFKNGVIDGGKGTFNWVEAQLKKWATKTGETKVTDAAFEYVHEQAVKSQDRNTYIRNYNLVNMDMRPALLSEQIRAAIQSAPVNTPEMTLESFGLSAVDISLIQTHAAADRQSDEAEGVLGDA